MLPVAVKTFCRPSTSAKILAEAGKKVIVVEEGGLYRPKDFQLTEEFAFSNLYRGRAGQATDNLAVTVLQGKCVGGSSTINWTTSLRTPDFVLEHWARRYGIKDMSTKDLDPYFERIEKRKCVRLRKPVRRRTSLGAI